MLAGPSSMDKLSTELPCQAYLKDPNQLGDRIGNKPRLPLRDLRPKATKEPLWYKAPLCVSGFLDEKPLWMADQTMFQSESCSHDAKISGSSVHRTLSQLNELKKIHTNMMENGNAFQLFKANSLMDMYVKRGNMMDARCVFENMSKRNVVSWNVMILGYAKQEGSALALELYARLHHEGVVPNDRTFVGALKACSKMASLEEGNQADGRFMKAGCLEKGRAIHFQIEKGGLESDIFVGTTLVDMYVKCGSIDDARHVFDQLPQCNVVSWTAMILGYASKGDCALALELYARMHHERVTPDGRTFVAALKCCSSLAALDEEKRVDGKIVKIGWLEKGRIIHCDIMKSGYESDIFVGNTLVDMYAQCGSMDDAVHAFDQLPYHNVVSWTAMILGYIKQEQSMMALDLYARMHHDGIQPSNRTFLAALKACSSQAALEEGKRVEGILVKTWCIEKGKAIHSHVVKSNSESGLLMGTALVVMYAKCGSMEDARHVFDMLPHRDVVLWTAMILGYAWMDKGALALELYAQMQQEGFIADVRIFVGTLKACSSLALLEEGKQIDGKSVKLACLEKGKVVHSQLLKSGFESDVFVRNILVDMYVKSGSMEDARDVFDKLPHRDVVSWNVMILGYAKHEQSAMVYDLYAQMHHEGIKPSDRTFVGVLKACCNLAELEEGMQSFEKVLKFGCLEKGRAVHSEIVKSAFDGDVFLGTSLVDMYAKCLDMEDAQHVFDHLPHRDVVSWNAMILGYAMKEEGALALEFYTLMHQTSVAPSDRTFVGALKACSSLAGLEARKQVDGKVVKLVCLEKGRAIHSRVMKNGFDLDVFIGNTMVDMYAKCGSMEDAWHVFVDLPHRDVVSWTTMIFGYAEQEKSEEAFRLYTQMQEQGLSGDSVTFFSILRACGNIAALDNGKEIHAQICRVGLETTAIVAIALIDMYAKCGQMVDAQQLFDALPTRNVVAWSALIGGYARQGESELVFSLFETMKQEGVEPNGVTFLSVLTVCSHAGLLDKGQMYFQAMSKQYAISPTIEHYNCMVDLFGRLGHVEEALEMVEKMPFQPDVVVWLTVLGACRKWKNATIGRHAFNCAVRSDKKVAAAYVLMSNIYAHAHMWEERDEIQLMRKNAQAWKKPGQSWWTDFRGKVHTFLAGDNRHPQSSDISAKLKDLCVKMEEEGYAPNLDCVLQDLSEDEKEDALCGHSEKLAIACALINTPEGSSIRVVKNLRVCDDCHKAIAFISKIEHRSIICRDASRFHNYKDGQCSCGDFW